MTAYASHEMFVPLFFGPIKNASHEAFLGMNYRPIKYASYEHFQSLVYRPIIFVSAEAFLTLEFNDAPVPTNVTEQLRAQINLHFKGDFINKLRNPKIQARAHYDLQAFAKIDNGKEEYQADFMYGDDERILATDETEDLDLYAFEGFNIGTGNFRDAFGQVVNLDKLVAIGFINDAESVGTLLVGGSGASSAFSILFNNDDNAQIALPPGAAFIVMVPINGYQITPNTNQILQLKAINGKVSYRFAVIARKKEIEEE